MATTNRKVRAKAKTPEVQVTEEEVDTKPRMEDPVESALDNAKKVGFKSVVTVGLLPNGLIDLVPSHPDYGVMHSLLNRAILELGIHEREAIYKQLRNEEEAGSPKG